MNDTLSNIAVSSDPKDVFESAVVYQQFNKTVAVVLNDILDSMCHIEYYINSENFFYNKSENILYNSQSEAKIFLIKRDNFFNKMRGLNVDEVIIHCNVDDFNHGFVEMRKMCCLRTRK